jgi:S1-C subfamily serine protease
MLNTPSADAKWHLLNDPQLKRCRNVLLSIAVMALAFLVSPAISAQQVDRLSAIVQIDSIVPGNARTAASLGKNRTGTGVVIDDAGLILTVGYVILEAIEVSIRGPSANKIPAEIIAYDHESGFGLIRAQASLDVTPLPLGDADHLSLMEPLLVASHVGELDARGVFLIDRRPFAGYWEYLLEQALFTSPPHRQFGGAALIDRQGQLVGIGSLILNNHISQGRRRPANMFIPINDLKPILADLIAEGRRRDPAHPWLGLFFEEYRGRIFVTRVAPGGPGQDAGVLEGDLVLGIDGTIASGLADFYRDLWQRGEPGVNIPLDVIRNNERSTRVIKSGDRYQYLRLDPSF